MTNSTTPPIVVGIDGSDAAHRAALWAADEAGHRHAALRLVWVVRTDLSGTPTASEYHHAVDTAKHALHAVQADVAAAAPDVDVEVSIQQGGAGTLVSLGPVSIQQGGAVMALARNVEVGQGSFVALALTPSMDVKEGGRVLAGPREAAIVGAVAGLVIGLVVAAARSRD